MLSKVRLWLKNSKESSIIAHEKHIVIGCQENVCSVTFLADQKHIVSCDEEGKIRRWRVKDGEETGGSMDDAERGPGARNLTVSADGKWLVVSGAGSGRVTVWDMESHKKAKELKPGHSPYGVYAVDISPDATRIATGSADRTICVWLLSTGQRTVGPLHHCNTVAGVKFSPDGLFVATATWQCDSIRIYDSMTGRLLLDVPIQVNSFVNQSLVWGTDNQLFALSDEGAIHCLDVSTGTTLSKWPIHSSTDARCIALARNGSFVAASANSSVSFWDTTTHERIGSVVEFTREIWSMAISTDYDLVTCGNKRISLHNLRDTLPSHYLDNHAKVEKFNDLPNQRLRNLSKTTHELCINMLEVEQKVDQERDSPIHWRTIPVPEFATNRQKDSLNETINLLRTDLHLQETGPVSPPRIVQQLINPMVASEANQEIDILNKTIESLRTDLRARDETITHLEQANLELRGKLDNVQRKADSLIQINKAHEQRHECEFLYAQGRIYDAAESILGMVNTVSEALRDNKVIMDWLTEFTCRCITALERCGDEALNAKKWDEAAGAYSAALSLGPSISESVLMEWVKVMLILGSPHEALSGADKFKVPRFTVYRNICESLKGDGHLTKAVEFFRQMQHELPVDADSHDERARWELDFRRYLIDKLEGMGDTARDSKNHRVAIEYYSEALSLDPTNLNDILLKRSNEVIDVDPSSHEGYEGKYTALHGKGCHGEAFKAFKMMLAKLEHSPDPQICELRHQYVDATSAIQKVIEQTICHMPRVLIDTMTGRLCDKAQQVAAFENLQIYDELRSSMTTWTQLDHTRIRKEVKKFYRYAMFSHRWEHGEPLFQRVRNISVYDLESSPPNIKLQTFCRSTRSLGFQWVWTDTCCIDRKDNVILQESLVAMFTWYRGSALALVYLRGVWSHSQRPGDLKRSIWNTRAWTYQEYIAAEVVQFYTEDWKPYLGLDMFNHKESPAIISEMEWASGAFARDLATLRPGMERVREKLFLASTRHTTLVEDTAYSLLGIFNASIPAIYGEGNRAVGRLLEHILTGSGDITILAWTGRAGSYNSGLPVDLTVYHELAPPHIPLSLKPGEMDSVVAALHSSLPDISLAVILHDHLNKLPSSFIAASRLQLSGIVFPVTELAHIPESVADSGTRVYRATTTALGDVEIKTSDDFSARDDYVLIHPWINLLLDRDFPRRASGLDGTTRALRLVARLRQPFGALLLAPLSRTRYRRVATDSLIMVRIREETPLTELIDSIGTVYIQ